MKLNTANNCIEVNVSCQCGNTFSTRSSMGKSLHLEICSNCHPAYTGKQKDAAYEGRVQQFNQKYRHLKAIR